MRSSTYAKLAFPLIYASTSFAQTCESYGIDIQSGGTYFQNNQSTAPFTALQEFEGCQADTANNLLVDPNGDQSQCSDTPLQPDDTPQLVNCTAWPKNKLYTGDWSLLIISNNGNGDPIAYERDFSLTVGPQQTATVTTTVSVTSSFTPIVNFTTTATSVLTSTVPSSTTTVLNAPTPITTTKTPLPVVSMSTRGLLTITQTAQTVKVSTSIKTVPASCTTNRASPALKDPVASILPTILGSLDSVAAGVIQGLQTETNIANSVLSGLIGKTRLSASSKFKREILEGRTPDAELKAAFVAERAARLSSGLHKRAPDQPTVTVTSASVVTLTASQTAATSTQTITTTILSTTTITSGVATVAGTGSAAGAGVVTVMASTSTRVITVQVPIAIATTTKTRSVTITNPVTTTSAGAIQSCASKKGTLG